MPGWKYHCTARMGEPLNEAVRISGRLASPVRFLGWRSLVSTGGNGVCPHRLMPHTLSLLVVVLCCNCTARTLSPWSNPVAGTLIWNTAGSASAPPGSVLSFHATGRLAGMLNAEISTPFSQTIMPSST